MYRIYHEATSTRGTKVGGYVKDSKGKPLTWGTREEAETQARYYATINRCGVPGRKQTWTVRKMDA